MASKLCSVIALLEKKGEMYVQPMTYETVIAYISGYHHGIRDCSGKSELDEFQKWLDHRVGHPCSLHWSAVIRDVFAGNDKQIALKKLFELFREFASTSALPKDKKASGTD